MKTFSIFRRFCSTSPASSKMSLQLPASHRSGLSFEQPKVPLDLEMGQYSTSLSQSPYYAMREKLGELGYMEDPLVALQRQGISVPREGEKPIYAPMALLKSPKPFGKTGVTRQFSNSSDDDANSGGIVFSTSEVVRTAMEKDFDTDMTGNGTLLFTDAELSNPYDSDASAVMCHSGILDCGTGMSLAPIVYLPVLRPIIGVVREMVGIGKGYGFGAYIHLKLSPSQFESSGTWTDRAKERLKEGAIVPVLFTEHLKFDGLCVGADAMRLLGLKISFKRGSEATIDVCEEKPEPCNAPAEVSDKKVANM